jgi:hypothetical protein
MPVKKFTRSEGLVSQERPEHRRQVGDISQSVTGGLVFSVMISGFKKVYPSLVILLTMLA